MEILLDEYYKQHLHVNGYVERKIQLDHGSYQIHGVTLSGKTTLLKQYLLTCKKSSYIYIDCHDVRIDIALLNRQLPRYCQNNGIDIVVLDNYRDGIILPPARQLLITTAAPLAHLDLASIALMPLDYEEFLAYEMKYDSTALNHFLQLGGLPVMQTLPSDQRHLYLQQALQRHLSAMEFNILLFMSRSPTLKLSTFTMYEKLKTEQKLSKDLLYKSVASLHEKRYLFHVKKFNHERAVAKSYFCDIALKNALTHQKNFHLLFENLIFLELNKRGRTLFYSDKVDFYIPSQHRIVLCMPFSNAEVLFKTVERIEEFIVTYGVRHVKVVTMSSSGTLQHPFVDVEMLPFSEWAIIEGE